MRLTCFFTGFFALLKGPVDTDAEWKLLRNSCDKPLRPNEQMCVKWPRFCSCVCSYSLGDVCAARRKEKAAGQTRSSDYSGITWLSYSDCHASVWHRLLLGGLNKCLKAFLLFRFFRVNLYPWETSSSWLRDGVFTKFCSQLHVFNCRKAIAQVKRKMQGKTIWVATGCLFRSNCPEEHTC